MSSFHTPKLKDQDIPDKICIPLFSHLKQRRVAADSSLLQQQLLRHLDNCQRCYRGLAPLYLMKGFVQCPLASSNVIATDNHIK